MSQQNPVPLMPEENRHDAKLAMELAAQLRPAEDIAEAYGYTPKQLARKIKKPEFRTVLTEAKSLWNADTNIRERIRAKAGMLVEDSLLDIYNIVTDQAVTANVRNQSFQSLTRVAAVDSAEKTVEGAAFKVVINIPDQPAVPITLQNVLEHEED